tara:strand:- start:328 stop:774 length:447 start_codon:yes stop_codon:yes gene_type:complete
MDDDMLRLVAYSVKDPFILSLVCKDWRRALLCAKLLNPSKPKPEGLYVSKSRPPIQSGAYMRFGRWYVNVAESRYLMEKHGFFQVHQFHIPKLEYKHIKDALGKAYVLVVTTNHDEIVARQTRDHWGFLHWVDADLSVAEIASFEVSH